jgi:hypothetical protein
MDDRASGVSSSMPTCLTATSCERPSSIGGQVSGLLGAVLVIAQRRPMTSAHRWPGTSAGHLDLTAGAELAPDVERDRGPRQRSCFPTQPSSRENVRRRHAGPPQDPSIASGRAGT